jgi:hypothetical protein
LLVYAGDRRYDRAASLRTNEVVACSAKFLPVAGYDPKHFLVTDLAAQHEAEIWLAPPPCPIPDLYIDPYGNWHPGSNKIRLFPTKARAKATAIDAKRLLAGA